MGVREGSGVRPGVGWLYIWLNREAGWGWGVCLGGERGVGVA